MNKVYNSPIAVHVVRLLCIELHHKVVQTTELLYTPVAQDFLYDRNLFALPKHLRRSNA